MSKNKIQVIICVEGGVVQGASASDPNVSIEVMDWDNAECDHKEEKRCKSLERKCKKMHAVY